MFVIFFFLMIIPLPGNERTGSNAILIRHDEMAIQTAAGAADCNGTTPTFNSVSEIWSSGLIVHFSKFKIR